MSRVIDVDGHAVEIGNPRKLLFPDDGVTKQDLVEYHRDIAPVMLPHVRNRAVTMHRFPDGIESSGFFQKHAPDHFPDWIRTVSVPKEEGRVRHVVCDDAATLVYLADQACITLHVGLSTIDDIHRPDRMVFDLDPPDDGAADAVRSAARATKGLLDELGLSSRVMTTGSTGFHVVVPLDGSAGFHEVRDYAHRCADLLAERHPHDLTVEQRIAKRRGRVFVDYLRNAYAETTVAPYSVRARPGAPVATPIDWEEIGRTDPRTYTVGSILRRLGQKPDPWDNDGLADQGIEPSELP